EFVLQTVPGELKPQGFSDCRLGAIGSDNPIGSDPIGALGCLHGEQDVIALRLHGSNAVEPADVQIVKFPGAFDQIMLDIVLCQTGEGGEAAPSLGENVE